MAKQQEELSKVSMSNTKKDILEAYSQLLKSLEDEAKDELQPAKEKEERRIKEVTSIADDLAAVKVTGAIDALKVDINAALVDIAVKMEKETDLYMKVREAIIAREKELADIFEIEKSAYSLAALLEAHKQKRVEFEEKIFERQTELEEEIEQTRTGWKKEQENYTAALEEQKDQDKTLRRRDQEEYEYNLKRNREEETNKLQDETKTLEKEIVFKREEFEREVADKEAELKSREEAVVQSEKEMVTLQVKVGNFPKEMDVAVTKAVKKVSERLLTEAAAERDLLNKTFEGEKNVLTTKIQALEQLTTEQKKQIELLSIQLDKAYGKVQDIAVKAVSSSRVPPPETIYKERRPE